MKIVSLSLSTATFAKSWKVTLVKPLLKKIGLELIKSNYWPVSNLSFLSKLVGKCALKRFNHHCETNNLMPDYQSAYRNNYSCKTALLKIVNDLLWNMENRMVTPLVAIDISGAFDTVDHNILLDVLSTKFSVKDTSLDCFESYLRPRGFQVQIGSDRSTVVDLPFCVPQGRCASPVLYSAYASTPQKVIPDSIDLHGFADDHAYKKGLRPKLSVRKN